MGQGADEDQQVEQVVERLVDHFPDAPRDEVEHVVDEEHHRLDGNPVRDYVPVLVEHESRDRLRDEGYEAARRREVADADAGPAATTHAGPDERLQAAQDALAEDARTDLAGEEGFVV